MGNGGEGERGGKGGEREEGGKGGQRGEGGRERWGKEEKDADGVCIEKKIKINKIREMRRIK